MAPKYVQFRNVTLELNTPGSRFLIQKEFQYPMLSSIPKKEKAAFEVVFDEVRNVLPEGYKIWAVMNPDEPTFNVRRFFPS